MWILVAFIFLVQIVVSIILFKSIDSLKKQTPRAFVNEKNEAVITLPDGETEIHNYDLKKK